MTIEDRKTGWLNEGFHCRFREILTHAMFRYGVCCPLYCCMPDHVHLLWIGILDTADQRLAVRYFRKQINLVLASLGYQFQSQPYDHVIRDGERERGQFEAVAEYIARNPERADLVTTDAFRTYPFTGCLVPGYPELNLWQRDYWERFWRTYSYLRQNGLTRSVD